MISAPFHPTVITLDVRIYDTAKVICHSTLYRAKRPYTTRVHHHTRRLLYGRGIL